MNASHFHPIIRNFVLAGGLLLAIATSQAGSWPQWRGPDASGHIEGVGFPTEWSETKNVVWKTKIPGRGHSSPVVEGDLVWMTTAYETPASEEDIKKRLQSNTGSQPLNLLETVSLRAVRIDPNTGKVHLNVEVFKKSNPQWVHKLNSYASCTPWLEDGKLYCHFGAFGNACLDAKTGKVLWRNDDKKLWVMHENGPGSSPILWGDHMIFHLDGSDNQSIAALRKDTGEIAWQTKRSGKMNSNPQLKKSYSTPILVKINGKDCVVSPAADWLYGYDPATGKELWKVPYGLLGFSNVARPVIGHGMIYVPTCFMKGEVLAIRYAGVPKPEIAWRLSRNGPKMPSPLLVGNELYIVNDAGIATCLDAKSGEVHWRERINAQFSASPTYADGKIYLCDRNGSTTVLKPGKTFQVLAKNQLEGGEHKASLTPYGKAFLVRTQEAFYRIEKK